MISQTLDEPKTINVLAGEYIQVFCEVIRFLNSEKALPYGYNLSNEVVIFHESIPDILSALALSKPLELSFVPTTS